MTRSGPEAGPLGGLGPGLWRAPGVRRILDLAGQPLRFGVRSDTTGIAVWGQRPSARRGEWLARRTGRGVVRIEDAFLRGLDPGRGAGAPPYGLLIDRLGVHYDATQPSEIETLLARHPLDDPILLQRAERAMARLGALGGGKYLGHDPAAPLPPAGHVLVVDQLTGDASVAASGADRATFLAMLHAARDRFPGHPVVVRAHPAATARRPGHLNPGDLRAGDLWLSAGASPASVLRRAHAVLSVSSGLALDAIWAGHRPILFGAPVFAGWGLSEDCAPLPLPRRGRPLSVAQLFAGLMLLAPHWYDPFRDRLCALETILDIAEAAQRARLEDRGGYVGHGMRLWKRRHIARAFGGDVRYPLRAPERRDDGRRVLAWASAAPPVGLSAPVVRVEDGFLRSRGLGARLVPPCSLIADPVGVYYDPARPSLLEQRIAQSPGLPPEALARSAALIAGIIQTAATKYGQGGGRPALPDQRPRLLVVGQVETDASVRCGATGPVRTNAALLAAARAACPDAVLLYKPHPDVEAGLRPGALTPGEAALADLMLGQTDPGWILSQVDRVWTLTSLMGFEALLRRVPVTCLGAPFYAGWGLSDDRAPVPDRRRRVTGVTLEGLAHAALIDVPRYIDPVTGRICPPEVVLERLAAGQAETRNPAQRLAAKAQGAWVTIAGTKRR